MQKPRQFVHNIFKTFKNLLSTFMESETPSSSSNISKPALFDNGFPFYSLQPIGYIDSGTVAKNARGKVKIELGNHNPGHFLVGLNEYSHVWLIFLFHENNNKNLIYKVDPPRLEKTMKVGVFATRTPHHPNPIGLTVAKLDKIEGTTVHLSSIDLIHGTPILDIKPYIATYDSIPEAVAPNWITEPPKKTIEKVYFSEQSENDMELFLSKGIVKYYNSKQELKEAISEVLSHDPRSYYWKKKKGADIYGFCLDVLNILCKFNKENTEATIIGLEDWTERYEGQKTKKACLEESKAHVLNKEEENKE